MSSLATVAWPWLRRSIPPWISMGWRYSGPLERFLLRVVGCVRLNPARRRNALRKTGNPGDRGITSEPRKLLVLDRRMGSREGRTVTPFLMFWTPTTR